MKERILECGSVPIRHFSTCMITLTCIQIAILFVSSIQIQFISAAQPCQLLVEIKFERIVYPE